MNTNVPPAAINLKSWSPSPTLTAIHRNVRTANQKTPKNGFQRLPLIAGADPAPPAPHLAAAARVVLLERANPSQTGGLIKGIQAMIKMNNPAEKTAIQQRLSRIEGQLRGVQKMIDADRNCSEVLQQLIAIRAAVHSASIRYLQTVANDCLLNVEQQDNPEAQREVMNALIQMISKVS